MLNMTAVTFTGRSLWRCLSSMELKPPMVSFSSPYMEPDLSRISTRSMEVAFSVFFCCSAGFSFSVVSVAKTLVPVGMPNLSANVSEEEAAKAVAEQAKARRAVQMMAVFFMMSSSRKVIDCFAKNKTKRKRSAPAFRLLIVAIV